MEDLIKFKLLFDELNYEEKKVFATKFIDSFEIDSIIEFIFKGLTNGILNLINDHSIGLSKTIVYGAVTAVYGAVYGAVTAVYCAVTGVFTEA